MRSHLARRWEDEIEHVVDRGILAQIIAVLRFE